MTEYELISEILRAEGGYVNDPDDRGGPTNFGITLETLSAWRGVPVTRRDVQAMTEAEAREIYANRYIEAPGLDHVPDDDLRALLVDAAVNHGQRRAVKWLQKALGVPADGLIGRVTLAELSKLDAGDAEDVRRDVLRRRIEFYGKLITRKPSQAKFAHGWMRRVAGFV